MAEQFPTFPRFDDTLGAIFVAGIIGSAYECLLFSSFFDELTSLIRLFGVTTTQAFTYNENSGDDSLYTRATVKSQSSSSLSVI